MSAINLDRIARLFASIFFLFILMSANACKGGNTMELNEKSFSVGESCESAVEKIEHAKFDYIEVTDEKIFASKKAITTALGYTELRIILTLKERKVESIWVKKFNHSI
ncbi:hypothetical protein [Xenophilus azovorans]|uniref:hypothetical protein n=1 Tax=Xenophilus azovorans TaxID=151755 RepID=UPI0012EE6B1A|nr:hypothetical protein [Xenophilus azovorans]